MAANILDIASYRNFAGQMDQKYGLPSGLTDWVIASESSYQNDAYNPVSQARGLGQFIPATAAWRGVDVNDPYNSIEGTASYLAYLHNKSGSWMTALNDYGTIKGLPAKAAQAQKIVGENSPNDQIRAALSNTDNLKNLVTSGKNPDGTDSITGKNTGIIDSAINGATNIALVILFFIFGLALVILAFASTDSGKEMINAGMKGIK